MNRLNPVSYTHLDVYKRQVADVIPQVMKYKHYYRGHGSDQDQQVTNHPLSVTRLIITTSQCLVSYQTQSLRLLE